MNEHDLLDQYLDTLSRDPLAAPPDGLDPQLAALARQVAIQHRTHLPHGVEGRVWQRLLQSQAQPPIHVEPSSNGSQSHWRNEFMTVYPLEHTRPQRWSLPTISLAAAVLIIVLFGGVLIAASQWGGQSEPPHAGAPALQGSPTFVPTATAYMGGTAEFFVTPTPLPFGLEPTIPYNAAPGPVIDLPPYQDAPDVVQMGQSRDGLFNDQRPRHVYSFDGKAGDVVRVDVTSSLAVQMQYTVVNVVTGEVNHQATGNSDGGGGAGGGGGGGSADAPSQAISASLSIPLTSNATVYLEVVRMGAGDGTYTISFDTVSVAQMAIDETIELAWDNDLNIARVDFAGRAGDIVTIMVDCPCDLMLRLRETQFGQVVAEDDDSGAGLNPELYGLTLPADGTYRIELEPYGQAVPSLTPVSVAVVALPNMTVAADGSLVQLTTKLSTLNLSAEVEAGRAYRVVMDTTMINANTSVTVVQGNETLASFSLLFTPRPVTESREFVAPASGEIRIQVRADANTMAFYGNPLTLLTVRVEPVE